MVAKKPAIGTVGLNRVFGKMNKTIARLEEQAQTLQVKMLAVANIKVNPHQPRQLFDPEAIRWLAHSIKHHGLLQPILVTSDGGINYVLIAGERRLRAVQLLQQPHIKAHVLPDFDWKRTMILALVENIQREALKPIEEAWAYVKLMHDQQLTQQELANAMGKTRVYIANLTRLTKLPADVQHLLGQGKLNTGQARPLIALLDQPLLLAGLVREILRHRWTSQMVERKVKALLRPTRPHTNLRQPGGVLTQLENNLTQQLGTKVVIKNRELSIRYTSVAHLNRLLTQMNLLDSK